MTYTHTLAATIRAEAAALHLTQHELAGCAGVSTGSLSGYMNGAVDMRVSVLRGIASALGMTAQELLDLADRRRESVTTG